MEKQIVTDGDSNILTKFFGAVFVAPTAFFIANADKALEDATGKGLIERGVESIKKEEEEKNNHYWRWAGKKLLQGTIKGIFGASFHTTP